MADFLRRRMSMVDRPLAQALAWDMLRAIGVLVLLWCVGLVLLRPVRPVVQPASDAYWGVVNGGMDHVAG